MTRYTHQLANLSAKPTALLASLDSLYFSFAILNHRTLGTALSVSQRENTDYLKVCKSVTRNMHINLGEPHE